MTVIKICGIIDPEDAKMAADLGADIIGINLFLGSKRYIEMNQALEIIQAAKENAIRPVGVFVNDDADQINKKAAILNLSIVQLHGKESREAFNEVDEHLERIFAVEVASNGNIIENKTLKQDQLNKDRDWLLYDSEKGGSGKTFNWDVFKPLGYSPWILSGGLNINNIEKGLRMLNPFGVDLATGVCKPKSPRKDYDLMARFIEKVRKYDEKG